MKDFKITYQQYAHPSQWFYWLYIFLACIYIILSWVTYNAAEPNNFQWVTNLVLAAAWIIIGLFGIFGTHYQYPDVTLSDEGITFGKKKNVQKFLWGHIHDVKIDNHAITLHTERDTTQEINIAYLQYKGLQIVKEKLKTFAQLHDINYDSKF